MGGARYVGPAIQIRPCPFTGSWIVTTGLQAGHHVGIRLTVLVIREICLLSVCLILEDGFPQWVGVPMCHTKRVKRGTGGSRGVSENFCSAAQVAYRVSQQIKTAIL
jgi:hypothetical protein